MYAEYTTQESSVTGTKTLIVFYIFCCSWLGKLHGHNICLERLICQCKS